MNDTPLAVQSLMESLCRKKSPEERLALGASLYDTAREIARLEISNRNPGMEVPRVRQEIFLRFYGDEFSPERSRAILRLLEEPR
jgi:hypothetical protein